MDKNNDSQEEIETGKDKTDVEDVDVGAKDGDNEGDSKKQEEEVKEEEEEGEATLGDYLEVLATSGLADKEDIEKVETLEDLVELQNRIVEKALEKQIESLKVQIGDVGAQFLKYVAEGGDPARFIESLKEYSVTPEYEPGNEESAVKVIKYYLKNKKGMDDVDIDVYVQGLKDKGLLEEKAERFDMELQKEKKSMHEKLLEEQKRQQEEIERRKKEFTKSIRETLAKENEFGGVELTPEEKNELADYITKTIIDDGGQQTTQFQKELQQFLADPKNIILLAKLAKHKFDLSFIKSKVQGKVVSETKKRISKTGKSGGNKPRSILDLLE